MPIIVPIPSQKAHWYTPDGKPFHTVPKKDGSGPRATTLADARKVGAYPSVTNVLGVLDKPGLDNWKIEQGILAALTLPRHPGEPLEDFARRVVADMGQETETAADFGSAVHAACEEYARSRELPSDPVVLKHWQPWREWFDANVGKVKHTEYTVANERWGYAGTVDLVADLVGIGTAVVDFKTQKVKRNKKGEPQPTFYETWPLQLAAYAEAIAPGAMLVSVVIDSITPSPVTVKVWSGDYMPRFLDCLNLWKYLKNYDPKAAVLQPF